MIRLIIAAFFLMSHLGCTEENKFKSAAAIEVNINEIPDDIKIPIEVWDLMESSVASKGSESNNEKSSEGEKQSSHEPKSHETGSTETESLIKSDEASHVVFTSVKVFLKEKNRNVLKNPSYVIDLPRGGGEVDLSSYMGTEKGTFYIGFELSEIENMNEVKTYFVSNTKKRKIDNEIFGAGCNKYFDISNSFVKNMKFEGIKLNTNRDRHISVIGGSFLFSYKNDRQVFVTQVTFKDTVNKHLFCEQE